ncbi:unnamed protein product, partial [Mesorhabditis belari]|uniref:Uncharacterized protein n=1 Tax=Mesorhabditis belari TaxID=2138241 RepID=A0AAF3EJH4_9BILA
MVTANEEWMEECKNRSENIHIHSAGGNWRNFTSDETSNKYFWIDRTFTCIADPDHFALVRINHKMDFPSDTKTITCGSRRKWVYKGEVVLNVGCYTGTRNRGRLQQLAFFPWNMWKTLVSSILGDATGPYIVGAISDGVRKDQHHKIISILSSKLSIFLLEFLV